VFKKFFKGMSTQAPTAPDIPSILGLRLGCSFELDSLMLRLVTDDLVSNNIATTQIIQAVGLVELDGTYIFRFYTDDEAFLQVVATSLNDVDVVDVKLFHFYDTLDIADKNRWTTLLDKDIGQATYTLEQQTYQRVWTSLTDYHAPVHMLETTYDEKGETSQTDQFTMLFERPISDGQTESLFLSAEEVEETPGALTRCLVISTGITLSPAQITIYG